jgi:hypothetical protein
MDFFRRILSRTSSESKIGSPDDLARRGRELRDHLNGLLDEFCAEIAPFAREPKNANEVERTIRNHTTDTIPDVSELRRTLAWHSNLLDISYAAVESVALKLPTTRFMRSVFSDSLEAKALSQALIFDTAVSVNEAVECLHVGPTANEQMVADLAAFISWLFVDAEKASHLAVDLPDADAVRNRLDALADVLYAPSLRAVNYINRFMELREVFLALEDHTPLDDDNYLGGVVDIIEELLGRDPIPSVSPGDIRRTEFRNEHPKDAFIRKDSIIRMLSIGAANFHTGIEATVSDDGTNTN